MWHGGSGCLTLPITVMLATTPGVNPNPILGCSIDPRMRDRRNEAGKVGVKSTVCIRIQEGEEGGVNLRWHVCVQNMLVAARLLDC